MALPRNSKEGIIEKNAGEAFSEEEFNQAFDDYHEAISILSTDLNNTQPVLLNTPLGAAAAFENDLDDEFSDEFKGAEQAVSVLSFYHDKTAFIETVKKKLPDILAEAKKQFLDGYTNHDHFLSLVCAKYICKLEDVNIDSLKSRSDWSLIFLISQAIVNGKFLYAVIDSMKMNLQTQQEKIENLITVNQIKAHTKKMYVGNKDYFDSYITITGQGRELIKTNRYDSIEFAMLHAVYLSAKTYSSDPVRLSNYPMIAKMFPDNGNESPIALRLGLHCSISDATFQNYNANMISIGGKRKVIAAAAPRSPGDVATFFDLIVKKDIRQITSVIDSLQGYETKRGHFDSYNYFFYPKGTEVNFGQYKIKINDVQYERSKTDVEENRTEKQCLDILLTSSSDSMKKMFPHMNRSAKFEITITDQTTGYTHPVKVNFHKTTDNTPPVDHTTSQSDLEKFGEEHDLSHSELMLIHCAAGIGRTGFTVFLGFLLDEAETIFDIKLTAEESARKIISILRDIRQMRPLLVVTPDQFDEAINTAKKIYIMRLEKHMSLQYGMSSSASFFSNSSLRLEKGANDQAYDTTMPFFEGRPK